MQENDKKSIRYSQLKFIQATSVITHLLAKYQATKLQTYFWVVRQSLSKSEHSLTSIKVIHLSSATISRNKRLQFSLQRQDQFGKGFKKLDKLFREKANLFKFQVIVSLISNQTTHSNSESYNIYQSTSKKQIDEDERIAIQFAGATQLVSLISTLAQRQKMAMFLNFNVRQSLPKNLALVDRDGLKLSGACLLHSLFEKKLKCHLHQLKVQTFLFKQRQSTLMVSLKEAAHRKSVMFGKLFQSVESEIECFLQSTHYTDSPRHDHKRESEFDNQCKKKMSQTAVLPPKKALSPIIMNNSSHQSSNTTLDKQNEIIPNQVKNSKKYIYLVLSQIILYLALMLIKFI